MNRGTSGCPDAPQCQAATTHNNIKTQNAFIRGASGLWTAAEQGHEVPADPSFLGNKASAAAAARAETQPGAGHARRGAACLERHRRLAASSPEGGRAGGLASHHVRRVRPDPHEHTRTQNSRSALKQQGGPGHKQQQQRQQQFNACTVRGRGGGDGSEPMQ